MRKRLLGLDFGSKRIGVAVSDPLNILARGVTALDNSPHVIEEIERLAEEFDVDCIVVGFPLTLRGTVGQKAGEVDEFIARLENGTGREVVRCDERFSSKLATETLRTMGVTKKARRHKGTIDEMAAALILQQYLDSHPAIRA